MMVAVQRKVLVIMEKAIVTMMISVKAIWFVERIFAPNGDPMDMEEALNVLNDLKMTYGIKTKVASVKD